MWPLAADPASPLAIPALFAHFPGPQLLCHQLGAMRCPQFRSAALALGLLLLLAAGAHAGMLDATIDRGLHRLASPAALTASVPAAAGLALAMPLSHLAPASECQLHRCCR